MPYVPKSKIAYKSSPEGQFVYKNTKEPFIGPYISIDNKEFYEVNILDIIDSDLYKFLINRNYKLINWIHDDLMFMRN